MNLVIMNTWEWMAWTWPTFIFFLTIILLIISMTVWEVCSPSLKRRGFLPMPTKRGERFFIALLASAFIFLTWLALLDQSTLGAAALSLLLFPAIMKWG